MSLSTAVWTLAALAAPPAPPIAPPPSATPWPLPDSTTTALLKSSSLQPYQRWESQLITKFEPHTAAIIQGRSLTLPSPSAAEYSASEYNAPAYSTPEYSTSEYSTPEYSALEYSTPANHLLPSPEPCEQMGPISHRGAHDSGSRGSQADIPLSARPIATQTAPLVYLNNLENAWISAQAAPAEIADAGVPDAMALL
ncbi:MAG: hypothetical protein AAF289_02110 [Cyanobacteria bacterium P01_A01_bin.135]